MSNRTDSMSLNKDLNNDLCVEIYPSIFLKKSAGIVREINDSVRNICNKMVDLVKSNDALGIAGNQVGILKRIIVCRFNDEFKVMINPVVVTSGLSIKSTEGCLSLPGYLAEVYRHDVVNVKYYDVSGNEINEEYKGNEAFIVQHENDHLNGILISDKVSTVEKLLFKSKFKRMMIKNVRDMYRYNVS